MLDVTVFNYTDTTYDIYLCVFQVDSDLSRSDARIYDERTSIEPEGKIRREDVAEAQQYIISYEVYTENSGRLTDQGHAHYYPDDDGEDDGIAFNIQPPGVLYRRNF